jgi:hypothetical protein
MIPCCLAKALWESPLELNSSRIASI